MFALFHTWLFCMHQFTNKFHWPNTHIEFMYGVVVTLMRALFVSYTALQTLAMDRGSPSFLPDSLRPYSTMWEATWPRSKCFSNTAISNLCEKTEPTNRKLSVSVLCSLLLPLRVKYNQNGITSFLTIAPSKKKIILLFKQGVRKYRIIIYTGFDLTTWIRIRGIKYLAVLIFEYKSCKPS